MFKEITKDNWLLFAQQSYDNPTLEKEEEFYDDIKIRLVLNHLIVLQNVFGAEAAITLLLYKIDRPYWPILKSCLNYLGYLYPHELTEFKKDDNIDRMLKEL